MGYTDAKLPYYVWRFDSIWVDESDIIRIELKFPQICSIRGRAVSVWSISPYSALANEAHVPCALGGGV